MRGYSGATDGTHAFVEPANWLVRARLLGGLTQSKAPFKRIVRATPLSVAGDRPREVARGEMGLVA